MTPILEVLQRYNKRFRTSFGNKDWETLQRWVDQQREIENEHTS